MTKITYDINLMKFISLFENITRAKVKDCISGDPLVFVVEPGEIGKAIGKKGSNIRRIEGLLRKRIKVVEFNEDEVIFVKNLISPLKPAEITKEDNIIVIKDPNTQTKAKIIGRDSKNLSNYKGIVSRYFPVKDIVVK